MFLVVKDFISAGCVVTEGKCALRHCRGFVHCALKVCSPQALLLLVPPVSCAPLPLPSSHSLHQSCLCRGVAGQVCPSALGAQGIIHGCAVEI